MKDAGWVNSVIILFLIGFWSILTVSNVRLLRRFRVVADDKKPQETGFESIPHIVRDAYIVPSLGACEIARLRVTSKAQNKIVLSMATEEKNAAELKAMINARLNHIQNPSTVIERPCSCRACAGFCMDMVCSYGFEDIDLLCRAMCFCIPASFAAVLAMALACSTRSERLEEAKTMAICWAAIAFCASLLLRDKMFSLYQERYSSVIRKQAQGLRGEAVDVLKKINTIKAKDAASKRLFQNDMHALFSQLEKLANRIPVIKPVSPSMKR
jgi:hypothetical protein